MSEEEDRSLTEQRMFDVEAMPHQLSLANRFTYPPFTLLDARGGWWQSRKREWGDLGLASGKGRTARTFAKDYEQGSGKSEVQERMTAIGGGTSIFDPVLAELAYRWFVPEGGWVLDPFAGGSVRGLVAATTGRQYVGIDLSEEQCKANRRQVAGFVRQGLFAQALAPQWKQGDSLIELRQVAGADYGRRAGGEGFDFVFSCPPYFDVEQYSKDPHDLSNMTWPGFLQAYNRIIEAAVARLAPDRFAGWVITEIRDKQGKYRNFVGETIVAFEEAGAAYYNHAVIVSPAGTLQLRTARAFVASRKLGKTHQDLLIFCKGDPKRAAAACDPRALEALAIGEEEDDTDDNVVVEMGHG